MENNIFTDPYIQKIYDNCKKGMTGSLKDWQRVADFMIKLSKRNPEKSAGLLECYNRLEKEVRNK